MPGREPGCRSAYSWLHSARANDRIKRCRCNCSSLCRILGPIISARINNPRRWIAWIDTGTLSRNAMASGLCNHVLLFSPSSSIPSRWTGRAAGGRVEQGLDCLPFQWYPHGLKLYVVRPSKLLDTLLALLGFIHLREEISMVQPPL